MSTPNVEDTAPRQISPSDPAPKKAKKPRKRRWLLILGGIFAVLALAAVGGFFGYQQAISERVKKESDQRTLVATTHFQMGLEALQEGKYGRARDQFEYVIALDPSFPGASDKLTEVMLAMATVATPTTAPTPTIYISPTPDTRTEDQLYTEAQQLMRAQDWDNAILTLDALRTANLEYHPLDVDGMYYIALRNRGINKITIEGNLEGGIYDLSVAETFAPIDKQADSYRTWARYYLTASSFWDVDWAKVVDYFGQIYQALPNLRDGSNYTAVERFRIASRKYGDQLAAAGDYCAARDQYKNSLSISDDPSLAPTATAIKLLCQPPTPKPSKTPTFEDGGETPVVETTEPPTDKPTKTPQPPAETATPEPTATEGS